MKKYLRAITYGIVGGLGMLSVACATTLSGPTSGPLVPSELRQPLQKVEYFDLVTIPDAPCEITIEGYAGGPQETPNGFLYLAYPVPMGKDGKPFEQGAIQFNCRGYVPWVFLNQKWHDLQSVNLAGGHNFYTLTPIKPPRPHPPTKQELMQAQYTFQGLRANCPQYDGRPIPIFDPMLDVVDDACFAAILQAHQNAGDKVIGVALSHQYSEPGVIPILQAGHDWTGDLPGLHTFLEKIIDQGFYIQLHLAGDGHSVRDPDGRYTYNDPVGHTYGCEWLASFFPTLADSLDDIHQYIRFLPGYDGIFYGCEDDGQPIKIPAFAKQFKARYPDGTLGVEFNTGHLPFGEGDTDWQPGGRMSLFDMVFAEFDTNLDQDSTWQIVARLQHVKGGYVRPPEQPAGDDTNPPAYLHNWPGVAVCFEYYTYNDVRFFVSPQQVQAGRDKLRKMGCDYVG